MLNYNMKLNFADMFFKNRKQLDRVLEQEISVFGHNEKLYHISTFEKNFL